MYLNRKVRDLKVAGEPALSGCVVVVACWYLALTGEDLRTTIPWLHQLPGFPRSQHLPSLQKLSTAICDDACLKFPAQVDFYEFEGYIRSSGTAKTT